MKPAGTYKSNSFIQRTKTVIDSTKGLPNETINSAIIFEKKLYLATEGGLFIVEDYEKEKIKIISLFSNEANNLLIYEKKIYFTSNSSLYCLKKNSCKKIRDFNDKIVDYCIFELNLWVLTENKIFGTDFDAKNDFLDSDLEGGNGRALAVSTDNIYVATETNLSVVHGKRMEWKNILPCFSDMPDSKINFLSFDEFGYLWVGTDDGAVIFNNKNRWFASEKYDCLPKNAVYDITRDGVGGIYFATDVGLIFLDNGKLRYFTATRWAPENKINSVFVTEDGSLVVLATNKGLSIIKGEEYTLAQKAEYYENLIEKYHIRDGFVTGRGIKDGSLEKGELHISDNDGLWTACNVAAEAFRYGATKDKDALVKARRGMNALLFLTQITGKKGFTARAIRYPGEHNFGDGDNEWHLSNDGKCEWKGETSSDEMTGHFFGFSVYYDLCANKGEKEEIRIALLAIMDHIIDNNFRLIDVDGKPTTWACWDPEMLNNYDKWFAERGINSLELLAFLKVSYHISGDEKYNKLYNEFIVRHHYPLNVIRHKVRDAHTCHIDDNLGFLATLTLLRLEKNPALRAYYLCGLEDHWQYEKVERQPLFAVIHAVFIGRDDDISVGVQSLREMPLDFRYYSQENSKIKTIEYDTEQEEWNEPAQPIVPLAFDERNIHRPDGSPFRLDSRGANVVLEPTVFLLPYYIGKYYGIIE